MTSLSQRKWRSELQGLGDRARDQGDFLAAAELYENAAAISDDGLGLIMIAGHMRKEGKDFSSAERHYRRILGETPDDPEIHMQLGHFYKIVGRYADAMRFYTAALEKGYPDTGKALNEIGQLNRHEGMRRELHRDHAGRTGDRSGLVGPRLLPRRRDDLRRHYREAMNMSRLGSRQRTRWGVAWTLRGVEAVRGHIVSSQPCDSLEIFLDQRLIHSGKLDKVPLRREFGKSDLGKYVFNAWIDFSGLPLGRHQLIVRAGSLQGEARRGIEWQQFEIVVAEPIPVDDAVDNPAVIPALDSQSPLSVVEQVNSLPSIVHRVTPGYTGKLDTVAVMRLDQLGDMVVTLPALRRLRELLPDARIVGLVSSSNIDLARTLGVFDEVVAVNFPDDASQEKRVMDERAQAEFIELCRPFRFDLAIDFLYSGHAAKLLPLTGAPVTMTVARSDQGETMEVVFDSRSPSGGHSLNPMSHTARVRVISEALALWLDNEAKPLPRETSSEAQLARYGLSTSDRYVVLHTGSSFARFLRWPHYPEVTEKLLEAGYKVLYMAGDDGDRARLPAKAIDDGRIIYLARKIPFDDLDALLSGASLMIGNDSGPKHWASLRGTRVISIHPGRDDLREWGQVFGGVVLGRRVPCAGCGIRYDDSECGQDFACIKQVRIEEVLREALTSS